MADLVGLVGAGQQHVGVRLQRAEHELEHRAVVGVVEVDDLLVPGVLVDQPGLFRREVAEDRRRQVVGEVLLEPVLAGRAGGQRVARRGGAVRLRPGQAGEVQAEARQVGATMHDLHVEAGALAGAVPMRPRAGELDRAVLRPGAGSPATARRPCPPCSGRRARGCTPAGGGVDVEVEGAVRVQRGEVDLSSVRLLRPAARWRARCVQPARRCERRRPGTTGRSCGAGLLGRVERASRARRAGSRSSRSRRSGR